MTNGFKKFDRGTFKGNFWLINNTVDIYTNIHKIENKIKQFLLALLF